MPKFRLILVIFSALPLFTGGCSSLLTKSEPAPVYYEVDYAKPEVSCRRAFDAPLRISEFTTATPFDRAEMVVLKEGHEVAFSGAYQWVALPGKMMADELSRDFSAGELFPAVETGGGAAFAPLELSGRIFTFGWEETAEEGRGVLEAEVSLARLVGDREVLFHRTYELRSPSHPKGGPAILAQTMSRLAGEFSQRLQEDLCRSLEK